MIGAVRQVLRYALTESRRRRRGLASESLAQYALFVAGVVGVVFVVGRLPIPGWELLRSEPGAFLAGRRFAAGETDRQAVAGFGGLLVLLTAYTVGLAEVGADGFLQRSVRPHVVAVPTPTLVAAAALAHVVPGAGSAIGLAALGAVAFAVGAGSPVIALTGTIAGVGLVAATTCLTYASVLTLERALHGSERARSLRVPVGAAAVGGFTLVVRDARESIELLGTIPVFRWYAALALLPAGAPPTHAVAAVAVTVGAVGGGLLAAVPAARRLRAVTDRPADGTAETDSSPVAALSRVTGRPSAVVAHTVWLRVRRRPSTLLYTLVTGAILLTVAGAVIDRFPTLRLPVTAVAVATTLATGPTLNVLGSEGHALPATFTAARGPRHLLAGYALAGVGPAVVCTTLATLLVAGWTGATPAVTAGAVLVAAAVGVAIPIVALAVGLAVPTYRGVRVSDRGTDDPGSLATTLLVVAAFLLASPTLGAFHGGIDPIGLAVGLTIVGLAAVVAARDARRRLADFDIDQ